MRHLTAVWMLWSQMLQKYGHQVLDKLEQDAPQGVEHSEESNQAQLLTDKAA